MSTSNMWKQKNTLQSSLFIFLQDSSSECSDKRKSQLEKPSWVDNDLYYSYQACKNFNEFEIEAKEAGYYNLNLISDEINEN